MLVASRSVVGAFISEQRRRSVTFCGEERCCSPVGSVQHRPNRQVRPGRTPKPHFAQKNAANHKAPPRRGAPDWIGTSVLACRLGCCSPVGSAQHRPNRQVRPVLNGPHRGPRPYRVVVIRPSRKKPRFYADFRYIAQYLNPFAKTVGALGTPGLPRFFWFSQNSSQTVVRGRAEREKSLGERGAEFVGDYMSDLG